MFGVRSTRNDPATPKRSPRSRLPVLLLVAIVGTLLVALLESRRRTEPGLEPPF